MSNKKGKSRQNSLYGLYYQLEGDDAMFDLIARIMNLQPAALENMPTVTFDKFKLL
jgi:hypothetical protein